MAAVPVEVSGESWDGGGSGNLLQTFWDLSSLEEQRRFQAAKKLVSNLRKCQVAILYYVAGQTIDQTIVDRTKMK